MKNILSSLSLIVLSLTFFAACGNETQTSQEEYHTTTTGISSSIQDESGDTERSGESVNEQAKVISLTIADESFIVTLADNSSAEALKELLDKGELTINMSDYGGFEKVGSLGESLPTNDKQMTTKLGDVILYQGDKLVIYYDTNSWSFTKLGEIENTENLKEALGKGEVTVTMSIKK